MIQHKSVDHIPKVCEHSTLLTNHLLVFRQIHNLGAVGDKDKLIDFEINGQRSKVKGHDEIKHGKNHPFKNAPFRRKHIYTGRRFAVQGYLVGEEIKINSNNIIIYRTKISLRIRDSETFDTSC